MKQKRFLIIIVFVLTIVFCVANFVLAADLSWTQSDWRGGGGQDYWSDNTKYATSSNIAFTSTTLTLSTTTYWYNTDWKYRQRASITNGGASTITDYQIPIFLNTSQLISAGKMKNDCADLRVLDSAGNVFPIWIATAPLANTCNQTTTKIWVKLSSLTTSGDTLYIYYGNNSATTASNGNNVFTIFGDFTTGSSLPSGWVKTDIGTSGSASVGSGSLTITNTNGVDVWQTTYGGTHVNKNSTITGGFVAEALITSQSYADVWAKTGITAQNAVASGGANGQAFIITTPGNGYDFQYQSLTGELCSGGSCPGVIAPNANLNGGTVTFPSFLKLTKNDSNQISGYHSSNGTSWTQRGSTVAPWGVSSTQYVTLFITPHNAAGTGSATYSFFYVRKYTSTEPSAGSPTNEEKPYSSSGSLTSSIFDAGNISNFNTLTYLATTPTNTTVLVKIRTSNNSDMSGAGEFTSCNSIASGEDISTNNCVADEQRYIQYQVSLNSTDNLYSPIFQNFNLSYTQITTYTLNYVAGANGSINGSSTQIIREGYDGTSITAVANAGYHFINWSDGSTDNPRTDTNVLSNLSITANFIAYPEFISPTPANNITIYSLTSPAISVSSSYFSNTEHEVIMNANNSLKGWWPFNFGSNLYDYSGYANTSTNNGATITTSGKYGNAYYFDGINDYLDMGITASTQITNNFTMSAWIKTTDTSVGYRDIIANQWQYGNSGIMVTLQGASTIHVPFTDGSGNIDTLDTTATVTDGNWHLINVTFSSGTVKIYVDGVEKGSKTSSSITRIAYNGINHLKIGKDSADGGTEYFKGTIDDVQIHSRILSADELLTLYDAHTNPYSEETANFSSGGNTAIAHTQNTAGNIADTGLINFTWIKTPNAPTEATIGANITTSSLNLTWLDNSSIENGFVIEKSVDGTNFTSSSNVNLNTTSTSVNGLLANTKYWLRVAAFNNFGTSTYSNASTGVYTSALNPTPTTTADDRTSITMSWSGGTADYYEVKKDDFTATTTSSSYQFNNLTCNTSYNFQVRAYNGDGIPTSYTDAISATTNACAQTGGGIMLAPSLPKIIIPPSFLNNAINSSVNNVYQMAISDNKDFTNISWQPYNEKYKTSNKTLYVKFRSKDGGESKIFIVNPKNNSTANNASKYKFLRNLKLGMTGEDVKELQKLLNKNGFLIDTSGAGSPGKESERFGKLTQNALIKFQKANNISPAAGYFGPLTRKFVN